MEQATISNLKQKNRREPLGFVYFGLVLFMFVYFARPQDWIPGLGAVPLAKITGILIFVALVFSFHDIRWRMPQEIIFLALFIAQLWLTVPFSTVWRFGAYSMMLSVSRVLPLVIVIYAAVRSMKRFRWILWVQAASVTVVAIASVAAPRPSGERLRGVLSGVYGNSNDLALIIDLTLPICLALTLTTRSIWKKLAWSVVILTMIYAVSLTASRGGAIALVVAALVCLWQIGVKERRFFLFLLVPIAVIAIGLYSGKALRERFDQTNLDPGTGNHYTGASSSAQQRKELLLQSLRITAQHPLFGVGPGNFPIVSGVWRVTHNSYTQISAEGGIPAFLLYVLFFWRGIANLREIRRYRKTEKRVWIFSVALEASLAAYLVGSFFNSVAYELFPYCLVAYTIALRLIVRRKQTVPNTVPQQEPTPAPVEVFVWE